MSFWGRVKPAPFLWGKSSGLERMVSTDRTTWRWLDYLFRHRFGLAIAVAIFALALVIPPVVYAQTTCPSNQDDYSQAMAKCQADLAYYRGQANNNGWQFTGSCDDGTYQGQNAVILKYANNGNPLTFAGAYFYCGSSQAPNPCASAPSFPGFWAQTKALSGFTFSVPQKDPSSGATMPCTYTFTPTQPPVWNPYSQTWQTKGNATPTGNPTSDAPASASSVPGDWADASGNPVNPQPSSTDTSQTSVPNVCDGGSCYDPNTDQYCSTAGGQQYCVSGATARSSSGGCSTGASSAICAGSPSAPVPTPSQQAQTGVNDPATQARSTDSYTQADPTTGATQGVNVTTYAAPGVNTSSGQKTGDAGPSNGGASTQPAHASSAGGNGSDSGGTDCNTPPVCTGDAVLCGIGRQQWATTCQVHSDLAGDGTGQAKLDASAAANAPSNAWVSSAPSSGNATADNASNGIYDQSGFGYSNQCPLQDLTVPIGNNQFVIPFSKGCFIGQWIYGIVIAFSLFAAARITMGSNS